MPDDEIRILHVDDDRGFAELTRDIVEQQEETFTVEIEIDPLEGLERLAVDPFDCVLSDFNMPGMNGLEFLREVRDRWPNLPFILFTGRGSEEIASEAISAGVTDYIQKEASADQNAVLRNRIQNAVTQFRTQREIEQTQNWYSTMLEYSSDYVLVVSGSGTVKYASPAIERVVGFRPDEVEGQNAFEFVHPDDRVEAANTLIEVIGSPERESSVVFRSKHKQGSWRWLEVRGRSLLDDPMIEGVMVNVRDITERKAREQALTAQTERLRDVTNFMSHDMRNQLNIARGRLEAITDSERDRHTDAARRAITRVTEMIEKLRELALGDVHSLDRNDMMLGPVITSTWRNAATNDATLELLDDLCVHANSERLHALFENLIINAIKHAGPEVTVRVGALADGDGFFVEDDGPGIPESERDLIFTSGFSGDREGTGLGLTIVRSIVVSHGWEIAVREGEHGGARFEIRTGTVTE